MYTLLTSILTVNINKHVAHFRYGNGKSSVLAQFMIANAHNMKSDSLKLIKVIT